MDIIRSLCYEHCVYVYVSELNAVKEHDKQVMQQAQQVQQDVSRYLFTNHFSLFNSKIQFSAFYKKTIKVRKVLAVFCNVR